eukprot:266975_1
MRALSIHGKVYELKQFHFHTPSEHTVDDEVFEMEMHLVHMNEESEIAVLGLMFSSKRDFKRARPSLKLSASRGHLFLDNTKAKSTAKTTELVKEAAKNSITEEDEEWKDWDGDGDLSDEEAKDKPREVKAITGNEFLDQFWSQLPRDKTAEEIALDNVLSFDPLFEMASNKLVKTVSTNEMEIDMELFEYEGSLTTPPYTEGVQWLVSKILNSHHRRQRDEQELTFCQPLLATNQDTKQWIFRLINEFMITAYRYIYLKCTLNILFPCI